MEKIRLQKPDSGILDVMMLKMNGYEICQEMRSDPEYQNIPIIILTAVASNAKNTQHTHFDGMTMEVDEYIPKPLDPDELAERKALMRK